MNHLPGSTLQSMAKNNNLFLAVGKKESVIRIELSTSK